MARIINGLISVGEPKGAYKLELERNALLWIDPSRHRTSSSASDAIHCRASLVERRPRDTRCLLVAKRSFQASRTWRFDTVSA
jgi:hypothetical protein